MEASRPHSALDPSPGDDPSPSHPAQRQRRIRALLSCGPCRASKLKCDRVQPCGQCARRDRLDLCVYAPKPAARKTKPPPRGMSSRLQRLEGMVRSIMDAGGPGASGESEARERDGQGSEAPPPVRGHVVRGTTYVGATHCMAMLEDIEDLKSYFADAEDDNDDGNSPPDDELLDAPEMLIWSRTGPASRDELLAQLPERQVADRLITRYFASMSPSQHVIHRPTFARAYARFWQDASSASLHWIAQLFMVLALGVLFNSFSAPHEVETDSPAPIHECIRRYRSCAGWALIWGKYTQPTAATLPAFLLYVEAHFLLNRAGQMNCYVLSGVCIRLMLKMGLHRDPAKLTGISPFEGEMRRRMWNMAIQIESLVAFHMGLPSMLQGVETDTAMPRNLQDDDFDEDSTALPAGRPWTDYTHMTYPIHKTRILRVFGRIARQAHALTPPSYAEVMELDRLLQEAWGELPTYMQARPLDECVGDAPTLIMQRFGLAALFDKCRCVLHRRYLAEPVPNHEHDYSRQQCLEGAMTLLAIHDYLLAAIIVYLVIQSMEHSSGRDDWMGRQGVSLTREGLTSMIRRSHAVWSAAATDSGELRKTADTLAIILTKLGSPVDTNAAVAGTTLSPSTVGSGYEVSVNWPSVISKPSTMASSNGSGLLSSLGLDYETNRSGIGSGWQLVNETAGSGLTPNHSLGMDSTGEVMPSTLDFDASWMSADSMDWRYLDISLAHSHTAGTTTGSGPTWIERLPLDDLEAMGPATWHHCPPGDGRPHQQG
ncbi:fungal specific transcription factor [Hirsutella rhossiliensis]|uniref:Fungal specific transcription factor domain-containing protein n=1 Tax=Hirsutella rhossiliensis TaxID=111463 RepID=A0A9P8MZT9_9HYPO|nr:fungal specific transcription factor domain-containing protein [Hirsutella rhossiliensis]KAH0965068.1 fungal specific transcription factor domain-containing protein [Hirsutella rhossiliensis]